MAEAAAAVAGRRRPWRLPLLALVAAVVMAAAATTATATATDEVEAASTLGGVMAAARAIEAAEDAAGVEGGTDPQLAATEKSNGNEQIIDNANDDGTGTTVVLSNGNQVHTLNSKYEIKEEQSKQRIKQEQDAKKLVLEQDAKREEQRVKADNKELDARGRANEQRLKLATGKFRATLEGREKQAARVSEAQAKRLKRQAEAREKRHRSLAESRAKQHALRTAMLEKAHKAMTAAGAEGHLSLNRAWRHYGGGWSNPRVYKVAGRIAVLQGLLRGNQQTGLVAQLGGAVRPAGGRLIFQVLRDNVPARVDVLPDGRVYLVVQAGGSSWLSLDGISYDVRAGDDSPALLSNWAAYGNGYRAPRQSRFGDVCALSGLVRAGEWSKLLLQLSADGAQKACLPPRRLIFSGPHHVGIQRLDLLQNPAGALQHVPAARQGYDWVSLDGLMWPAGYGRPLRLNARWTNYDNGYARAAYATVDDSLCALSGLVKYRFGSWDAKHRVIAHLPVGCRPQRRLVVAANGHERMVRLDVLPSGALVWVTGSRHGWVSLAGIRFVAYN